MFHVTKPKTIIKKTLQFSEKYICVGLYCHEVTKKDTVPYIFSYVIDLKSLPDGLY